MIEFTIKTLDSNNHEFCVSDEITVAELKQKVRQALNIEISLQRLIFCGRVLQDDKKLSEYNVDGKVVHLVQRAPPCPESRFTVNDNPSPPESTSPPIRRRLQPNLISLSRLRNEDQRTLSMLPTTGRLDFIKRMVNEIRASLDNLNASLATSSEESSPEPMVEFDLNLPTRRDSYDTEPIEEQPGSNSEQTGSNEDKPAERRGMTGNFGDGVELPSLRSTFPTRLSDRYGHSSTHNALNGDRRGQSLDSRGQSSESREQDSERRGKSSERREQSSERYGHCSGLHGSERQDQSSDLREHSSESYGHSSGHHAQCSVCPGHSSELNDSDQREQRPRPQPPRRRVIRTRQTRTRLSRPRDLADLIEELDSLYEQFAPHRARYVGILRSTHMESTAYPDGYRYNDESISEMVSDIIHSFAHAFHAVSDIHLQVEHHTARLLSDTPALRQPIPIQAHINVIRQGVGGNSSSTASSGSSSSPQNAAPAPSEVHTNSQGNQGPPSQAGRNSTQQTVNINILPDPIAYQVEIETRVPIAVALDNAIFNGLRTNTGNENQPPPEPTPTPAPTQAAEQTANQNQNQANRRQVLFDFENLFRGLSQSGGLGGVEVLMSMEEIPPGGILGNLIGGSSTTNNNNATNSGTSTSGSPASGTGNSSSGSGGTGQSNEPRVYISPMPWEGGPNADLLQNIVSSVIRQGLVTGVEGVSLHAHPIMQTHAQGQTPQGQSQAQSQRHAQPQGQGQTQESGQVPPQEQSQNQSQGQMQGQPQGQSLGSSQRQRQEQSQGSTTQVQNQRPPQGQTQLPSQGQNQGQTQGQNSGQTSSSQGSQESGGSEPSQQPSAEMLRELRRAEIRAQVAEASRAQAAALSRAQAEAGRAHAAVLGRAQTAASRAHALSLTNLIYDRFLHCDSIHARRHIQRRRELHQEQLAMQERNRLARQAMQDFDYIRVEYGYITRNNIQLMNRIINGTPNRVSWLTAVFVTLCRQLLLSDIARPLPGEQVRIPNEFVTVRRLFRAFFENFISTPGMDDLNNACEAITEYLLNENSTYLNSLHTHADFRPDVDVIESIRSLLQMRLPTIFTSIMSELPENTYPNHFYSSFGRLYTDLFTLLNYCSVDKGDGVRIMHAAFLELLAPTLDEPVRCLITRLSMTVFEAVSENVSNFTSIMHFVRRKRPERRSAPSPPTSQDSTPMDVSPETSPTEEPMWTTPPATPMVEPYVEYNPEVPLSPVEASTSSSRPSTPAGQPSDDLVPTPQERLSPQSFQSEKKETNTSSPTSSPARIIPPLIIVEHWGEEWMPVFSRDQQLQNERASAPEEPYSDAYLSGMPSRKRRRVMESRPPSTLNGLVEESITETTERAPPPDERIRMALREHMRSLARNRTLTSGDYDATQFSSVARFLNVVSTNDQEGQSDSGNNSSA